MQIVLVSPGSPSTSLPVPHFKVLENFSPKASAKSYMSGLDSAQVSVLISLVDIHEPSVNRAAAVSFTIQPHKGLTH